MRTPHGSLIFLIVMIVVVTCPWYSDAYYQIRKVITGKLTKKEQEDWAFQIHSDLFDKLTELIDDPFMSDYKLREWLPICRYSDDLILQVLPKTKLMQLEQFIIRIIDEPHETFI